MNSMRTVLTWLTILAFPASCSLAQDKPLGHAAEGEKAFATLKKAYEDALATWSMEFPAAYQEAKKNGKEKDLEFGMLHPNLLFSPRFLAIAEHDPEGPEAIDALKMTLQTSHLPRTGAALETRGKAIKILQDHYATKPSIIGFLRIVTQFSDDDSKALVALVIASNPDRKVHIAAYRDQIAYHNDIVMFADSFDSVSGRQGFEKAFIEAQLARAEKSKIEIESLEKTLRESYSDLYDDLSVGSPAPKLELQTVDGSPAKLSALKGKVVVLDIWATWCGPCKAMIPHEREMVARLKGKPFELVGIGIDSELKPLQDFLAKEKLPWAHWWAGPGGWQSELAEAWDIRSIPAIFVLDAKGVIRYKNIRGDELEKAVNSLLAETDAKPAASSR